MKNRIVEYVIEPINEWYGREMNEGQAKTYGEVLCNYSNDILQKAILELKATWSSRFMPLPANVREVCDRLIPRIDPANKTGRPTPYFWEAAERIMPTRIGKLALQESWARSLICEVMSTGREQYTQQDVDKFRAGKKAAEESAKTLTSETSEERAMQELWWTMQKKEQEIVDRYKHILKESY